jgi:hypothetical protein
MATKTYNPKNMLISFGGAILQGFAKGTFLEAERAEDGFKSDVGSDGEVARTQSNNKMGTITFTLMHHVQSNDVLSAFAALDEISGEGVLPFFAKELNGTTVMAAANAWVKKLPKVSRGDEASNVEWSIECADLEVFTGGLV